MLNSAPGIQLLIESRMGDALHGDPAACFDLGIALAFGRRTRENLIEALKWFTLAAQAGYEPATQSSAKIAFDMSSAELAEARRRTQLARSSTIQRQVAHFTARAFA